MRGCGKGKQEWTTQNEFGAKESRDRKGQLRKRAFDLRVVDVFGGRQSRYRDLPKSELR
jgi:hypothetical protein